MIKSVIKTLQFVINHPLNKNRRFQAVKDWAKWQLGSRLVPGSVVIKFVNDVYMLVKPGMTGATGNIYAGLHEFPDMSFVLHCLRKEDLFIDVGANIGSYTLLAGGAVGAKCIAIEPMLSTFKFLEKNIVLNDLKHNVTLCNIAVGHETGSIRFTSGLDTENHVVDDAEANKSDTVQVFITTLDDIVGDLKPKLIKIDVEGFETNVISAAYNTLSAESLDAILIELNGLGMRYGFDEEKIHTTLLGYGFMPYIYAPLERSLSPAHGINSSGNTLYIRNVDNVLERLRTATPFNVLNQVI